MVCGNEAEVESRSCPFCGAPIPAAVPGKLPAECLYRRVNLEKRHPRTEQALEHLEREIALSAAQGVKVLNLIHGYGSSGRGGAIREAVRLRLDFLQHQGRIKGLIEGEHFSSRSGPGRHLVRRFPFLARHRDLGRANPGITLVLL